MASDPVLALPPGDCCVKGFKYTGNPTGSLETITGLTTYIARPAGLDKAERYEHIILYFPDIFGPLHLNNQLIMDALAYGGYLVVAPDYFEGDPIFPHLEEDPNFDIMTWIMPKRVRADNLIEPWIEAVKAKFGTADTKYAAVGEPAPVQSYSFLFQLCFRGYCFGAPDVLNLTAGNWIKAGAIVHPALLSESHFKNSRLPVLIQACDDHQFGRAARHRAEDLLAEEPEAPHHVEVFAGFPHGFAARGDMSKPITRWGRDRSTNGIIDWFDQFLKNGAVLEPNHGSAM
ncbi:hypothetical protein BV25DRAFT_1912768 [Artomyces pyxidatus]|uniref:Uncharacterized protein n=1 Tax=Artomyces pyxidatus TaxID=48021 RepID=A0ACB8TEC6_9AGAM|nr:hypothetical protein BV25DRAFT_1912768 [Artomyces pyxidatus]